jgi:hypothetical protein
VICS